MKKIFKISTIILTISIFAMSFYIMVFGSIARRNNELLSIFGYSYSAVPTNSMAGDNDDSFTSGSFILTKKVKYDDITLGDIIVFKQENILVVHRVIEIKSDGSFITKGDNNNAADINPITRDTYQAKVIKSFSGFGFGKSIGSYQSIILLILIFVLIIFMLFQIFNIFKSIHDEKLRRIKEDYNKERAIYEK